VLDRREHAPARRRLPGRLRERVTGGAEGAIQPERGDDEPAERLAGL
jgi:hypothetical protein